MRRPFPPRLKSASSQAMIAMIAKLIARELAYQAEDKSVYFRINRFPEYGHLAHFDLVGIALHRPGEERRV